jgi:dTDP-4-amino-4,6-dideoxygalactose transaminase
MNAPTPPPHDPTPARSLEPLASAGGRPVRDSFLPLATPWIGEREKQLVLETLESGWITTGPRTHEFGERIAALAGARHGLAVNSATGALHLALAAFGVKPGDEVITSVYTFAACVNVIEHVGATPVLVDIEPDTLCLDPRAVERALTPRTRAVMPVDYAGHPCDYDALLPLCRERGIPVVEDAAHALGAAWRGRPVGSLADVTAFSFYATKNLTTGEGGAAVTDDDALAERMALLSLHGMNRDAWRRYGDTGSWYYEVSAPGFKYNMSDVLAAMGIGQLERFEEFQRRRAAIVARYQAGLGDLDAVRLPVTREGATHAWHLFPIALELERLTLDRAAFIRELRAENIGTSVHFIPIHFHPHFGRTLGRREGDFPVAEAAYRRAITLPLFPRMSDRDVDDVVAAVRKVAAHARR